MALVVVATFLNLTEAQVAAGALESGGLHPMVMDQGFGSVLWPEQFALQGFRLAVLGSEAAEARQFLSTLPPVRARRRNREFSEMPWRLAAVPALFLGGPNLSWLMVGGMRRRRRGAALETLMGGLIVAATGAVGVLVIAGGVILALMLADALVKTAWPLLPLVAAVAIAVIAARRRRSDAD